LTKIPISVSQERQQCAVDWNPTATDYSRDMPLHRAFESQVNRSPDATAFLWAGRKRSYRQLNDEANRLEDLLVEKGVTPGSLVGVFLERSAEMVAALLGVLKAGSAYVPLDPAYPPERLRFLIDDASLCSIITHSSIKTRLP